MRNIVFILCFLTSIKIIAQDQIFKKDNSKVEAKILEINQSEIKYKLFTYPDGPTITISKNEVALIVYQNGVHEVFNQKNDKTQEKPTEIISSVADVNPSKSIEELTSTKHIIGLNIIDPLNGTFGICYLTEVYKNLFNVYVPLSTGFAEPFMNQASYSLFNPYLYNNSNITNFKLTRKSVEAGIGIHFQTSGKQAVTHFIGPYFGMAQYNGTFDEYQTIYDPNYGYYTTTGNIITHGFVLNRYHIMLDNGFLFRASKNINVLLLAGVGYHNDKFVANDPKSFYSYNSYYNYRTTTIFPINSFKLNLSIGYRF